MSALAAGAACAGGLLGWPDAFLGAAIFGSIAAITWVMFRGD